MEIVYTLEAKEDIDYWKRTGNAARLKKIRSLLESIAESPFEGIGKPGPLMRSLAPGQEELTMSIGLFTKYQGVK